MMSQYKGKKYVAYQVYSRNFKENNNKAGIGNVKESREGSMI